MQDHRLLDSLRCWGAEIRARRAWWLLPAIQAVVVLVVVLALPRNVFLASPDTDLVSYFIGARAFAAENLRAGHLPLWNPYIYGGQPFLGGFESALLYPPTLIFVWLPLDRAMNLTLLGHLLFLGWGMQYWVARRGLHPLAAAFACLAIQFSGPVFPHLYAGHLSNLCTMAWVPWLYAFLDDWRHRRSPGSLLLAAAAVCFQILGGHVQYVFYTGVAVGLYSLLHTVRRPSAWRRELPAVAGVYMAGSLLAAAQLLPGFEAVAEGVRSGKTDFRFASMYAFPPENLLTLVAPGFFGDLTEHHPYWGGCDLWEMTIFIGAVGAVLVAVAMGDGPWRRHTKLPLAMVALLGLLALGHHTPLFRLLYRYAPLFGSFRGISKFTFQAMLFLVPLLAMGVDALVRGRRPSRGVAWGAAGVGVLAGLVGLAALAWSSSFAGLLAGAANGSENFLATWVFTDPHLRPQAARHAAWSLVWAGTFLLLSGLALWQARRQPRWGWLLLAILPLEWANFAFTHFATCERDDTQPEGLPAFLASLPGGDRILNLVRPNNGFFVHTGDLWGNDPGVLKRYAEFMTATQGGDFRHVTQSMMFRSLPPVYAMLRLRCAILPRGDGFEARDAAPPMPRALLISSCAVLPPPEARLAALQTDAFDPRRTVLLETAPVPWPEPVTDPGTIRIVETTCDTLTLEADANAPTLLLVTDLYSTGWQVRSLPGSVQENYQVQPADHVLLAVPLRAGHHRLRLEYRPKSLNLGIALSSVAWLGWLILAGRQIRS